MNSKRSSFSLIFYLSKTKVKKNGLAPIYLQIYIDGEKTNFQIRREVDPELWDSSKSQMKGKTPTARTINEYIQMIRVKAHNQYNQLLKEHDHVTPFQLRDAIMGKRSASTRQVIEIWDEHLDHMSALIGKETTHATVQKYRTCKNHFREFLLKTEHKKDIPFYAVDNYLVTKFDNFLKSEKNVSHNTAIKFLQSFKKIIRIALNNGWIARNPFENISFRTKEVARPYLTEEELERIMNYKSDIDRIERVKDFFLFSCFTGLAYADVQKLTGKELIKTEKGYWIKTTRLKTGTMTNIPLLPVPKAIIEKYAIMEQILEDDLVLPIISNQKMNVYLKELADVTGIKKKLSFHVARHTFATTVTLMNGVPIESVSKMLGHKDIRTTQHYARIVDKKVEADMEVLQAKLEGKLIFVS